jgi:hypothetical protein
MAVRLENFGSFAFFAFACDVGKMEMCQNVGGKALFFWMSISKYKCRFGTVNIGYT